QHDLGREELHAEDVQGLAPHVLLAHVDLAGEAQERGDGRGGDAVLAGPRLGDDPRLAHPPGEEPLAERVVDLVGAGVAQVLALEMDPGPARLLGEPAGEGQRGRPADVLRREVTEPARERGIASGLAVGGLQLEQGRHERLGDVATPVRPEVPRPIGKTRALTHAPRPPPRRERARPPAPPGRTPGPRAGSWRPGPASTPEFTSTPHGRAIRMASPTVSGRRPADRITRPRAAASRASVNEIGARAWPSLQRAGLSSRNAAGLYRSSA